MWLFSFHFFCMINSTEVSTQRRPKLALFQWDENFNTVFSLLCSASPQIRCQEELCSFLKLLLFSKLILLLVEFSIEITWKTFSDRTQMSYLSCCPFRLFKQYESTSSRGPDYISLKYPRGKQIKSIFSKIKSKI